MVHDYKIVCHDVFFVMKKDILASILNYISILNLCLLFKSKFNSNDVYIVAYHKIIDVNNYEEYLYDADLISADSRGFEKQLSIIKKYFEIRTFDNINKPHKKPRLVITFDDGHKDNYQVAYPILKKNKLSATFYISTGYIGTNSLFWFESVVYRLLTIKPGNYRIDNEEINIPDKRKERLELATLLLRKLKTMENKSRISFVKYIEQLPVKIKKTSEDSNMIGNLSWEEVREMSENGMEIGSHSITHPILSKLNNDELNIEIEGSKNKIEKEIKKKVRSISYPNGGIYDYDNRVKKCVLKSGYQYGLTYVKGINKIIYPGHVTLLRLHVERYTTTTRFKAILAFPGIFS